MRVLVDTNVILDVLLNRPTFFIDSRLVFELAEQKQIIGYITASSITDIFYIVSKEIKNNETVYQVIENLTALFSVVPVSEATIANALALRWKDFEDAVQFMAARENDISFIVTRNISDYKCSDIHCITPTNFIQDIINS